MNTQETMIEAIPDPPEWLGSFGCEKWQEIGQYLVENHGFYAKHREILGLYCDSYQEFREAMITIEKEGTTCVSDKGGLYQHPEVSRKNAALKRMVQLGKLFGWDRQPQPQSTVPSRPKNL